MTKSNKNDSGVGAVFIIMPISAIIALGGHAVYTSGVATGFGFIAITGVIFEIIGIMGMIASICIMLEDIVQDLKNPKNKKGKRHGNKQKQNVDCRNK